MVERLLVVVDITVLSVVEPAVVLAVVAGSNVVRLDVNDVEVSLSVVNAVAVVLTRGVDFVVIKLVVVPSDEDVKLLTVDSTTPRVGFLVLKSCVVDNADVMPGVVKLTAVELLTELVEETVNLLLVVDVPSSSF